MEECSYLTCCLCLLSYLPYTTQHHLPLHSTVRNGLGFPTSIRNLENIFPAIPTLQTYEDYPQLRFSLPSHVLACIRLTKIHFDRGWYKHMTKMMWMFFYCQNWCVFCSNCSCFLFLCPTWRICLSPVHCRHSVQSSQSPSLTHNILASLLAKSLVGL